MTLTPSRHRAAVALRFIAVVPCLIALPIFLIAGWGYNAWALSAALLALNIALAMAFDRAGKGRSQVTIVGMVGISLILRAWLTFAALFVIAWSGERELAIAAAGAFLVYFTFDMAGRTFSHVLARDEHLDTLPVSGGSA